MQKKLNTTLLFLLLFVGAFAGNKTAMNIKITVKELANTKLILANYYGDKQYVKDTIQLDKGGTGYIKQDTMYQGGVYLAVFPALGNRYFEFILSEPHFSLETDTADLTGHMKVSGSEENTLFYDDMKYLGKMRGKADSIGKLYKSVTGKDKDTDKHNQELASKYRAESTAIDSEVKAQRSDIMQKHPDLFYAKLLKSMKEIDVPQPKKDASGKNIDSSYQQNAWYFYKTHYWDNVDLHDDRLLRCPVLHNKLKTFMTQTVVQVPDSINDAGDDLLAKTNPKSEMFRYILTYIFNEMANSQVMGFDNCYVHFGKKYFCTGMAPWVDSVKLFKICDRVNRLAPNLIGKQAQKMILPTDSTETQWKSLYDIKAKYTIVAFWDPDCGHCKKEIPVLIDAYHNLKKQGIDVEGYCPAIMEIEAYKNWIEFIKKNNLDWINLCDPYRHNNFRYEWDIQSTPQIYILDKNKVIKARRIGADQVEDYIKHLENPNYRGKLTNKMKENDDDSKQPGADDK